MSLMSKLSKLLYYSFFLLSGDYLSTIWSQIKVRKSQKKSGWLENLIGDTGQTAFLEILESLKNPWILVLALGKVHDFFLSLNPGNGLCLVLESWNLTCCASQYFKCTKRIICQCTFNHFFAFSQLYCYKNTLHIMICYNSEGFG